MQQRQTEQNIAAEKQQTQFHQEAAALKHELSLLQRQVREYERLMAQNQAELKQYESLAQQHECIKEEMRDLTHQLIFLKERNEQYEQQLQSATQDEIRKNKHIGEYEKHIAILIDNNNRLENNLKQVEDIEALRQEKLFLVQEKVELKGTLKQLERANA